MPNAASPELRAVIRALRAQEDTLAELTRAHEKQTDSIAGVILVLRALIDLVLDEEQRAALETHLTMSVRNDPQSARQAIVDALLD